MLLVSLLFFSNRGVFNAPVEHEKLGLTTYLHVVKRPMDLGTIRNNLLDGMYENPLDFSADVKLVFENAMLFNPETHFIYKAARLLLRTFTKDFNQLTDQLEEAKALSRQHFCEVCRGRVCCLCSRRCLELKRSVLRCSAPCNSRIQRNHVYYRNGGDRGQHWCQRCYSNLPDTFIAILGQRVEKSSLQKLRNDEVVVEPWICCARCNRPMHQVCALYSPLLAKNGTGFVCCECAPCTLGNFQVKRVRQLTSLKHSAMGSYLEKRVKTLVRAHLTKQGAKEMDSIVDSLTLRVVASSSRRTHLEPRVERWIQAQQTSIGRTFEKRHFDHISKTLLIFQTIDGVDVLLFVLYTQEYGDSCAEPNRNKVYISYLDSISYMKPRSIRSVVYQQTMMGYIAWVRARGFRKMYIWACPPKKEDAYIIYCHPKWQRTPSAERLRKWYGRIIEGCQREGTVLGSTNMYDAHLSVFKPLVNTRSSRKSTGRTAGSLRPMEYVQQMQGSVMRNRPMPVVSSRADREGLDRNIDTGKSIINPVEDMPYFYGDYLPNEVESVLASLSRLRSKVCQSDELVSRWWEAVWGSSAKARLVKQAVNNYNIHNPDSAELDHVCELFGKPVPPLHWKFEPTVSIEEADVRASNLSPNQRNEWLMRKLAASIKPMRENFLVLDLAQETEGVRSGASPSRSQPGMEAPSVFEPFEGEEMLPAINAPLQELQATTKDPDELLPAGIFDTRLFFLDFCQANHLQFDELRRAKHSSLMLLFALQSTLEWSQ